MPFQIGNKLILTIHDIAFGGEGVGRTDDFVVFVPVSYTHLTLPTIYSV